LYYDKISWDCLEKRLLELGKHIINWPRATPLPIHILHTPAPVEKTKRQACTYGFDVMNQKDSLLAFCDAVQYGCMEVGPHSQEPIKPDS